ncbi:MAG: SGNH/GDSL hydrolase family protein [Firmicutes bacterium]|jgi:lysophospholipase L1-like esterase|nr:SGNH/GDSL hydrolase family protein [Bacillota bacterium]
MNLNMERLPFQNGERILFQGDSITDVGRRRNVMYDLGNGYVSMIRGLISALRPDLSVEILNRGNSGDRTTELLQRWQQDCLDLHPDWLSIYIGVNDVWRKRTERQGGQRHVPLPEYVTNYRRLLDQARDAGIRNLVLVSPTFIDKYLNSDLNQLIAEYDHAVQGLAQEYGALYVPLRQRLQEVLLRNPEIEWLGDGCHPTPAGHAFIAATWLETVIKGRQ